MFNNQCSIKGLNMEFNRKNKDIIGKFFFALSVIILIYMLVTPLNHLILHVDEYFTLTLINFSPCLFLVFSESLPITSMQ